MQDIYITRKLEGCPQDRHTEGQHDFPQVHHTCITSSIAPINSLSIQVDSFLRIHFLERVFFISVERRVK